MPHVDDQPVGAQPPATPRGRSGAGPTRRSALLRLGALGVSFGALAAVFFIGGVLGPERIRGWIDPLGPFAPLVYIPLAALLGTFFVPGAALAAAAGLLFGAWQGALCSMAAGTGGALLSRAISKRAAHDAFTEVATDRMDALAAVARRNGILAVILARLAPMLPDAVANHSFGIAGLAASSVAIGHLIAAGPRALAYSTVGANSDDLVGRDALMGWALNGVTGLVGALLLAFVVVRHRRAQRASASDASFATGE